jgi:NAD(P)-dependent dehydrogenase (short-subunit alcohol dehydrogenase family)
MPIKERVLITGAAAGIGRATADRCRAEGYEVVGVDRDGDGIRADLSLPDATAAALAEALRAVPSPGWSIMSALCGPGWLRSRASKILRSRFR